MKFMYKIIKGFDPENWEKRRILTYAIDRDVVALMHSLRLAEPKISMRKAAKTSMKQLAAVYNTDEENSIRRLINRYKKLYQK